MGDFSSRCHFTDSVQVMTCTCTLATIFLPSFEPGDVLSATCYPNEAADYFGENYAHRLRWAHAVNSLRVLRSALRSNAHFLEADVSAGTLMEEKTEVGSILVARCDLGRDDEPITMFLELRFRPLQKWDGNQMLPGNFVI